ncbi:DH domain-containing protein [Entamoeba marina]
MDSEENVTLSLDCGTNALLEYQVVVNYIEDNPLVMYNKSKERILEQLGILIKHGVSIVEVMNYLMVDNQTEIMRLLVKGMNKELARIITTRNYEEDREIFYNVMSSNKKKTLDIQPRYEDVISMISIWCGADLNDVINDLNEIKPEKKFKETISLTSSPVHSSSFSRSPVTSPRLPKVTSPSSLQITQPLKEKKRSKQNDNQSDFKITVIENTSNGLLGSPGSHRTQSIRRLKTLGRKHRRTDSGNRILVFKPQSFYLQHLNSIGLIQSLIRGQRVRKVYGITSLLIRKEVLKEIDTTEENFYKKLVLLEQYFKQPLKVLNEKGQVTTEELNNIFNDTFDRCLSNGKEISRRCREMHNKFKYDSIVGVELTSLFYLIASLQPFTTNINLSLDTWKSIKERKEIQMLINTNSLIKELNHLTFDQLVLEPVQRIMRYPMLIEELIKCTKPQHPDYSPLKKSFEEYHHFALVVNERKDMRENFHKICIEYNFFQADLREGWKKSSTVYLCNDILIICVGKDKLKHSTISLQFNNTINVILNGRHVTVKEYGKSKPLSLTFNSTKISQQFHDILVDIIKNEFYILDDDRSYTKLFYTSLNDFKTKN